MGEIAWRTFQARANIKPVHMAFAITIEVHLGERARSDQAHVSFEDAPKIQELIERGLANDSAPLRYTLFRWQQDAVFAAFVGHVAEFKDCERLPFATDPLLLEEQWTTYIEERDDGNNKVDRQGDDEGDQGDEHIEEAFAIFRIEIRGRHNRRLQSIDLSKPIVGKTLSDRLDLLCS